MSDTNLADIQLDLVERIKSDPFFDTVPVLDERKGDIVGQVNQALGVLTETGGKIGACIIVMSLIGRDELPNVSFGPLELEVTCQVMEDVTVNTGADGTELAALTIARHLIDTLKHHTAGGLMSPLIPAEPVLVPVESPFAPLAYEVRFKTRESDETTTEKVAIPQISPNGGASPQAVTLTCATSGAAIYYTVDGSYPRSGNPEAELYALPFAVASAAIVRAGAYKSGSIPSDIARADFT